MFVICLGLGDSILEIIRAASGRSEFIDVTSLSYPHSPNLSNSVRVKIIVKISEKDKNESFLVLISIVSSLYSSP